MTGKVGQICRREDLNRVSGKVIISILETFEYGHVGIPVIVENVPEERCQLVNLDRRWSNVHIGNDGISVFHARFLYRCRAFWSFVVMGKPIAIRGNLWNLKISTPDPVRRPLEEEGSSPGGAAKRQKSPEKRGQKREGEESHREAQVAEREEARGSNDPAPPAQGSEAPAAQSQGSGQSDMVSVLEANMFHKLESKKEIYEISQLLCSMGISKSDVAEIYNPERFTSKANLFGLRPGFAVDLMVSKNSNGDHWDLSKDTDQRELRRLLKKEKPLFLVGSPPCGPFSPLQNLSKYKRTDEENQQILEEGRMHLKVAVDCYLEQHNHGRFFLHEHPKPSASWQEPEIERLASLPGVYKVESPMCKWEMVAEDQQGVGSGRIPAG